MKLLTDIRKKSSTLKVNLRNDFQFCLHSMKDKRLLLIYSSAVQCHSIKIKLTFGLPNSRMNQFPKLVKKMFNFLCTLVGHLKSRLSRMRSTAMICLEKLSFLQNKDQQSKTGALEKIS